MAHGSPALSSRLIPTPSDLVSLASFLPSGFTLTNSLPRNRANFSLFYDGAAATWMQGIDAGAVVHWVGQYDNVGLTGSTKPDQPRSGPLP